LWDTFWLVAFFKKKKKISIKTFQMDRGIEGGRDFSYLPFGQGLADAA
jgi:hypothetical protein